MSENEQIMAGKDLAAELRGVSASYGGGLALDDVSIQIPRGSTVGILGVNGAGKTTTLKVLAGLMGVKSGEVYLNGAVSPRRRSGAIRDGVALSPEGRRLFPAMTVEENLRLGSYPLRDLKQISTRLQAVYNRFERVYERRYQKAGTLSGGEQQMVALGRAIMRDPEVLLLDEPTLGLSPIMIDTVSDMISKISAEGMTIVLVEHNAMNALKLCDYAYVLDEGRVVSEGDARALTESGEVMDAYLAKKDDHS